MSWTKPFAIVMVFTSLLAVLSAYNTPTSSSPVSALSVDWTERVAIVINADSMFTAEKGVVSGNGTKLDPYIIEGWKIGPLPNGTAIDIRNTNAYFRIRNVYAYSCSIGVLMNNVHNGWVEDSQFIGDSVGVAFFESDDCKVVRSTFEGSDVAILISFSDVSQSDNIFINNDIDVQRNKHDTPWELTWVGAVVCAAILVPLSAIIAFLLYFRVRRYPPPPP